MASRTSSKAWKASWVPFRKSRCSGESEQLVQNSLHPRPGQQIPAAILEAVVQVEGVLPRQVLVTYTGDRPIPKAHTVKNARTDHGIPLVPQPAKLLLAQNTPFHQILQKGVIFLLGHLAGVVLGRQSGITIYRQGWNISTHSEYVSGNTAYGRATFTGPSGESRTASLTLTCDKNGNVT